MGKHVLNQPPTDQQLSPMDDESSLSSLSDAPDEQEAKEEDKSDIDVDDIELDAKIEEARKALQVQSSPPIQSSSSRPPPIFKSQI